MEYSTYCISSILNTSFFFNYGMISLFYRIVGNPAMQTWEWYQFRAHVCIDVFHVHYSTTSLCCRVTWKLFLTLHSSFQPWRITLIRSSPTSSSLCLWSSYTPYCRYLCVKTEVLKDWKHLGMWFIWVLSQTSLLYSGNVQVRGAWHLVQHAELSEDPVSPWRVFVPRPQGSSPVSGLCPRKDAHPKVCADSSF